MTKYKVTIVVLNWRQAERTLRCLQSLRRLEIPCHIIVVDNGSDDGSAGIIAQHFEDIELIALPQNVGFAAGCNIAIQRALEQETCEYVFLVNNDTVIHPMALSELLASAEQYPQGAILGPKVYCWHNRRTIWYAGARRRRGVFAAASTGRGRIDNGQYSQIREVDYVFGAAMLIHRRVFERVGLFDERFFLYLEDLDYCIRAQTLGYPIVFVPAAHVWHEGSASTSHDHAWRRSLLIESTALFLRKHASPITALPIMVYWSLLFFVSMVYDFIRGDMLSLDRTFNSLKSGFLLQDRVVSREF